MPCLSGAVSFSSSCVRHFVTECKSPALKVDYPTVDLDLLTIDSRSQVTQVRFRNDQVIAVLFEVGVILAPLAHVVAPGLLEVDDVV